MNDLQKEIARLQNLKQNKNKDKSVLERMATISLWRKQANIGEKFTETAEKKMAEELFDNYLANYEFTSYNDITNVSDLVFAEITKLKIQQQISEINSDENSKFVPDRLIGSLHEVQERIWALKEKAGIVGKKEQDDLTALEDLQKKFKCISEDSLVLMADFTTKKIQDVNIGDEILGLENIKNTWKLKKQTVLNKRYNGVQEVIKIKTLDKTLELTPDHLILAEQGKKKLNSPIKYFEASNTWGHNVKTFNYIKNLDDYYKGMLIGWIESDGHKTKSEKGQTQHFITQIVEYKAIDWLLNHLNLKHSKKYLENIAHGLPSVEGKIFKCYRYQLSTDCNVIIKYAYDNLLNNKDIGLGFLAGFMLGDGTINKAGNWIIYQSRKANSHKIEIIENVLKKYNISYCRNDNRKDFITVFSLGKCKIPILCKNSKKYQKWLETVYECKPFYDIDKSKLRFVDIEQKKRVWDLTTELGNFIVNGFVVHNCYIAFNRNEFTLYSPIICQKCGEKDVQPILLRRRVKDFDVLKHPFFSGRFYYNRKGMALVKTGIWTKEQYAWVFETSVKYVDWCLEHENDIIELSDVDQQEINDFINSKEYLKEQKIPENLK